jgi:hypothetical protein
MRGAIVVSRVIVTGVLLAALSVVASSQSAFARDVEYSEKDGEIEVFVNVGEPTEVVFDGAKIRDGFKNSNAGIALDRKDSSLVIFAKENMNENGEAILVRLDDGRSYPLRIRKASTDNPRDAKVSVGDGRGPVGSSEEDRPAPYREQGFAYAPPSKVSGLMREMVLAAEFGKATIPGYTTSEKFKGQTVISDGAVIAKIDKMYIGSNLWGYVLDATNLLDQTQKVNPASFRIDGTRAISLSNWELSPRPLNVEEQISNKHNAKVYIVTRAR